MCICVFTCVDFSDLGVCKLPVAISEIEANNQRCPVILKRWLLIASCFPSDGGDYFPLSRTMGSPVASTGVLGSIMTLSLIKEFDSGLRSSQEIKGLTEETLHAQNPRDPKMETASLLTCRTHKRGRATALNYQQTAGGWTAGRENM